MTTIRRQRPRVTASLYPAGHYNRSAYEYCCRHRKLPELPLLITKLLKDLGVDYQIQRDRPNIPAAQRVQAVLLDDSIGAMLVLFPRTICSISRA